MPEATQGPDIDRPGLGRSVLITLASLALIAGGLGLGALTPPESPTTAAPLETEPVTDQPDWHLVETVPGTAPSAVIHHGDQVFVFASTPPTAASPNGGLQAWRSLDGLSWESMGTVLDTDHEIDSITSTSLGLVLIEADDSGQPVRLWMSADGVRWLPLLDGLPLDGLVDNEDPAYVLAASAQMQVAIGSDASLIHAAGTDEREIALVSRHPDFNRPYRVEGFEIWTAELP